MRKKNLVVCEKYVKGNNILKFKWKKRKITSMILSAKFLIFPCSLTSVFTTVQRKLKKPTTQCMSDWPARIVCLLCICTSQSDYEIQENEEFGWESHLLKEN